MSSLKNYQGNHFQIKFHLTDIIFLNFYIIPGNVWIKSGSTITANYPSITSLDHYLNFHNNNFTFDEDVIETAGSFIAIDQSIVPNFIIAPQTTQTLDSRDKVSKVTGSNPEDESLTIESTFNVDRFSYLFMKTSSIRLVTRMHAPYIIKEITVSDPVFVLSQVLCLGSGACLAEECTPDEVYSFITPDPETSVYEPYNIEDVSDPYYVTVVIDKKVFFGPGSHLIVTIPKSQ